MNQFINWFNNTSPSGKAPIKNTRIRALITYLYFKSIHHFEDGNGRIGRAIAEKALLQTLKSPLLIGISSSIEKNKKLYYQTLEKSQRSNEITNWVKYFLSVIINALDTSEKNHSFYFKKD